MSRLWRLIALLLPLAALLTAIPATAQSRPKPTHIQAGVIAQAKKGAPGDNVWRGDRTPPTDPSRS